MQQITRDRGSKGDHKEQTITETWQEGHQERPGTAKAWRQLHAYTNETRKSGEVKRL